MGNAGKVRGTHISAVRDRWVAERMGEAFGDIRLAIRHSKDLGPGDIANQRARHFGAARKKLADLLMEARKPGRTHERKLIGAAQELLRKFEQDIFKEDR